MYRQTLSVKYSLFGRYDYIETTPENVSKLYAEFSQYGFMPNMVTLLRIRQPQNIVEQILRPQLVNTKDGCTITILPERIDIEFINGASTENVMKFVESLIVMYELKINRIALNSATEFDNLSAQEIAYFNANLTPPANYAEEMDLIEYNSRRVSRKSIGCIDEPINIGRNIEGISDIVDAQIVISRIKVETDINTLGEFTKERFTVDDCCKFFESAASIDKDVIENILVMQNES